MGVADLHDLELVWPNPVPTDVIVTGTFDQWSSSIHLAKDDAGFSGTVKVPWGEKVAYKFIVDGRWQCRGDRPQEDDGHGNLNNVVQVPTKPVSSTVQEQLARLSIPPEVSSEGYNDAEMMVTAVEWMPTAEPAVSVCLPLPTQEVAVEESRPDATPPTDAPMNESTLDISADTEEIVTSTESTTPEVPPSAQPSPSSLVVSSLPLITIIPVDDGSISPLSEPRVNGNGEAHPPNDFADHVTIPFSKEEPEAVPSPVALPAAVEPETADEAVVTSSEFSAADPAQVIGDVAPVPVPVSVPETPNKNFETDDDIAANGHRRRASAPPATLHSPSPSSLSSKLSSTMHKKRRSLFARIRHVFDKDKDKVKEKSKEKSKA